MDDFDNRLIAATAGIRDEYFMLPIRGGNTLFRERVYCYELYHQLRKRWPDPNESPWRLNGEVDKQTHPYFPDRSRKAPKPDFLVHQPGNDSNFAIVEVKSHNVSSTSMNNDVKKLALFCREFHYQRGIQLVYGQRNSRLVQRFRRALQRAEVTSERIELWVHEAPMSSAEPIWT